MAHRHPEDDSTDTTDDDASGAPDSSRRTFIKTVGVAAALTGAGSVVGNVAAAESAEDYLDPSGEVYIPPGEYSWQGSGLDVGSGDALIGDGDPGDVVLNLVDGTMDGSVGGHLENIVVRGENQESKAGLNLEPGATVDGFVYMDGALQDEDRILYNPDGGSGRVTLRNSAWGRAMNNGAYIDKTANTIENCAAVNNNIANLRIGHRDGTSESETTYVRNTLIALTEEPPANESGDRNARGLRIRHPGNFVIENCWFVYKDVSGGADLIELHDGAAGANVTIRDCAFYNDSGGDLVRDKSDGDIDVTIENCTVEGSGSREVEPDFDGDGFTEASAEYPLPSAITGRAAADDLPGVGADVAPFSGETAVSDPEPSEPSGHTLVLHASPDNDGDVDPSFTVDSEIEFGDESEPDTDTIVDNGDGTWTATSVGLDPDALDSYHFEGDVIDYDVPDDATVDVSLDGTTTTWAELVGEDDTSDDGSTDDGSTDDGSTDDGSTDDGSTDDGTSDDSSGDGSTDDGSSDGPTHRISVVGTKAEDPTAYTFTVTGDVERDEAESEITADGSVWDEMKDIARDGKVIGLVGSGVDAYRFTGMLTEITVDGDATVSVERDV